MAGLKRNDPCHCGSGKKYKFCCQRKDQEAERQARKERRDGDISPLAPVKPAVPPLPPDPQMEAINALWDEFQAADYEGKIALFYDTLVNKPDLMDKEIVFEFFLDIYPQTVERNERNRFEALAEALREQLPDVYAAEAGNILSYRITNALTEGRYDDIPAMTEAMATNAETHIDDFFNLLDQLAYHNRLATLISATRLAWPRIKDSTKVFGGDELAQQAVDYLVFDHISCTVTPDGRDPALLVQIEPYMDLNLELFSAYIATISGQQPKAWTLDDFQFEPARDRWNEWDDDEYDDEKPDGGRQNLAQLSWEFLNYLFQREQVPYVKGELARTELYRYIVRRFEGGLDQDDELPFGIFNQPKRKKRRSSKTRRQRHLLCPDRSTLDRFLTGLVGFLNPQYYKAVTLLELVPAWLRFLESRQLISSQQREQTLAELRGLDTELSKIVQSNPDPALLQAMVNWRDNAEQ